MHGPFRSGAYARSVDAGHLYKAEFYNDDRSELSVIINEDGSVCKNEGHYVLTDTEDEKITDFLVN